ncbi:hypothetical protein N9H39_09105, partial [Gammaproteobacteria bacterium]|nr:hypothetical protein [Gammaproteobacteria bacterium]
AERVLRKINRIVSQNFTWGIRKDTSTLTHFYTHMYKPYVEKRFGPFAIVDNFYKVRRLFRTGLLVAVSKDTQLVSALICRAIDRVLWLEMIGIENAHIDLLGEGVGDATSYALLEVAFEMNCTHINFRDSRPFLNDGVLRYKQGWGACLINDRKACREIGVQINLSGKIRYNPFFNHYPIFIDQGSLSGFVILSQEKVATLRQIRTIKNTFMNPGLRKLHIFSLNGFDEEVYQQFRTANDDVRIIDLTAYTGSGTMFSDMLNDNP